MSTNEIAINNIWNKSDIKKFILKYYVGIILKTIILLCIGVLLFISIGKNVMYIFMNALLSIIFLLFIYNAAKLITKKLISKCKSFTITNDKVTIDDIKIESVDEIILLDNCMLICYFKSYFLINTNGVDLNDLKTLISSNNIKITISPKHFSLIKLAYSSK